MPKETELIERFLIMIMFPYNLSFQTGPAFGNEMSAI